MAILESIKSLYQVRPSDKELAHRDAQLEEGLSMLVAGTSWMEVEKALELDKLPFVSFRADGSRIVHPRF